MSQELPDSSGGEMKMNIAKWFGRCTLLLCALLAVSAQAIPQPKKGGKNARGSSSRKQSKKPPKKKRNNNQKQNPSATADQQHTQDKKSQLHIIIKQGNQKLLQQIFKEKQITVDASLVEFADISATMPL